jgi:hypothetical protein
MFELRQRNGIERSSEEFARVLPGDAAQGKPLEQFIRTSREGVLLTAAFAEKLLDA